VLRFALAGDPATVAAARRLHGRVYLAEGYVDTLVGGMVDDPYVTSARYFVATAPGGEVVGVCRQIVGLGRALPTLTRFALDAPHRRWADAVDPGEVVEVSALAVDRGRVASARQVAAGLYRQMWQRALVTGEHRYWVANVSERLLSVFNDTFGFGFEAMGPPQTYMGPPTVPCRLELVGLSARVARTHPHVLAWFCEGMPAVPAVGLTIPAQATAPAEGRPALAPTG